MDKNHTSSNEHMLRFTINGKQFEIGQQYITGRKLRELGEISPEHDVYLTVPKPWKNELISDEDQVNLARPEVEHFISLDKKIKIILVVNGREKPWEKNTISFEEIVTLAFGSYDPNPNKVYTVSYDKGPKQNPEGTMVKDNWVFVKNKMIFNVTATDKS